jgi:hypothetical protein
VKQCDEKVLHVRSQNSPVAFHESRLCPSNTVSDAIHVSASESIVFFLAPIQWISIALAWQFNTQRQKIVSIGLLIPL